MNVQIWILDEHGDSAWMVDELQDDWIFKYQRENDHESVRIFRCFSLVDHPLPRIQIKIYRVVDEKLTSTLGFKRHVNTKTKRSQSFLNSLTAQITIKAPTSKSLRCMLKFVWGAAREKKNIHRNPASIVPQTLPSSMIWTAKSIAVNRWSGFIGESGVGNTPGKLHVHVAQVTKSSCLKTVFKSLHCMMCD